MDFSQQADRTVVVNINRAEHYDVYIGRSGNDFHYGNPFSTKPSKYPVVKLGTPVAAIGAFYDWLHGKSWRYVEQERRSWILAQVRAGKLDNKRLGCFCAPGPCHGRILAAMANYPMSIPRVEAPEEVKV